MTCYFKENGALPVQLLFLVVILSAGFVFVIMLQVALACKKVRSRSTFLLPGGGNRKKISKSVARCILG